MSSKVKIALAGIGGYGDTYLEALLHHPSAEGAELAGVADPSPQRCKRLGEVEARGVPVYPSLEALLSSQPGVELMLIATPIHLHSPQTCRSLAAGANVLCEKPLAGDLSSAMRMAEAERASGGRFVAIGYQWSYSQAVQALKREAIAGELGRPVRLRTIVHFPRGQAYFRRNQWAGRVRTAAGEAVLDSPVNNAAAHYLHNMFYVLGKTRETSATPASVEAELYRANGIENYDTAALRVRTECGTEVLFYATHAVPEKLGPRFRFEFERAVVEFDASPSGGGEIVARFADGRTRSYGSPNVDRHEKVWEAVEAVRTGRPVACGIRGALPHTLCVLAAQESAPRIRAFPAEALRRTEMDGDALVWVEGLAETLEACYERGVLPAELGRSWARPATRVSVQAAAAAAVSASVKAGRRAVAVAQPAWG